MPIHIRAEKQDFAKYVLLPGDPNRAKYVSEKLDNAKLINDYRGMLGYTGTYKGVPISVQTTGMGCPSASIVIEELIQLGVDVFLRIGTCGGIGDNLRAADTIIATGACPVDGSTRTYLNGDPYAPVSSFELTYSSYEAAKKMNLPVHTGLIASVDVFYNPYDDYVSKWKSRGVLAFEMEASSLFYLASRSRKQAGTLLTVSDMLTGHKGDTDYVSDEDLKKGVDKMIELSLETIVFYDKEFNK